MGFGVEIQHGHHRTGAKVVDANSDLTRQSQVECHVHGHVLWRQTGHDRVGPTPWIAKNDHVSDRTREVRGRPAAVA